MRALLGTWPRGLGLKLSHKDLSHFKSNLDSKGILKVHFNLVRPSLYQKGKTIFSCETCFYKINISDQIIYADPSACFIIQLRIPYTYWAPSGTIDLRDLLDPDPCLLNRKKNLHKIPNSLFKKPKTKRFLTIFVKAYWLIEAVL